jgi:hypothetical protein
MQDKKKTTNIKVRDLKPKKDAKGGMTVQNPGTKDHGTKDHGTKNFGTKNFGK